MHILFLSLLPSCRCDLSNFQDYPYEKILYEMINEEAYHKAFNEPLAHIKSTSIQTHASLDKPRRNHHHEPNVKMIVHVNHYDIEV